MPTVEELMAKSRGAKKPAPASYAQMAEEFGPPPATGIEDPFGVEKEAASQGLQPSALKTVEEPDSLAPVYKSLGQAAKTSALPIAGGVAGAVAGGAVGGPAGAMAGEALGGAAGEVANQIFGITPPSVTDVVVQGALPPVMKGAAVLGGGVKTTVKGAMLSATQAGRNKLSAAGEELVSSEIGAMKDKVPFSGTLFKEARDAGYEIPVNNSLVMSDKILDRLMNEPLDTTQARMKATRKVVEDVRDFLNSEGAGKITPDETQSVLHELRVQIDKADPSEARELIQLMKAVEEDMDVAIAAGKKGAEALKKGRESYHKEMVFESVENIIQTGNKMKAGQLEVGFTPNIVANKLLRSEDFKRGFSQEEQKEIISLLGKVNLVGSMPTSIGKGSRIQFASGLMRTMFSPTGRAMVRAVMDKEGRISEQGLSAIQHFDQATNGGRGIAARQYATKLANEQVDEGGETVDANQ